MVFRLLVKEATIAPIKKTPMKNRNRSSHISDECGGLSRREALRRAKFRSARLQRELLRFQIPLIKTIFNSFKN
jgi:hypothetical protein